MSKRNTGKVAARPSLGQYTEDGMENVLGKSIETRKEFKKEKSGIKSKKQVTDRFVVEKTEKGEVH